MRKAAIYILLAASILAVLIGLFGLTYDPSTGLLFLIPGVIGVIGLYFLDKVLDRRLEEQRDQAMHRRIDQLLNEARLTGKPVVIESASNLFIGLTFFLLGATAAYVFRHEPSSGAFFWGLFSAALGGLMLLATWPTIGRPKLTLSKEGLSTPKVRRIPWSAVYGIFLQENRARDSVMSHTLMFFVPELAGYVGQMHPVEQFLYRFKFTKGRKLIGIILRRASEEPEVIYDIAKELWKDATGRDYPWDPGMSDKATAALMRISEFGRVSPPQIDPRQLAFKDATALRNRLQATEKDFEILAREMKKRSSRLTWMVIPFFVLLLILAVHSALR